jgi:hypothetical protein
VFDPAAARAGAGVQQVVMKAIAECGALVAVMRPDAASTPSIGVEIGAAWAWKKPVYVISTDETNLRPPLALSHVRVFPPSRIDDLIYAFKQDNQPLSDDDRAALLAAYKDLNIPTDQLVQQPAALENLAARFGRGRRRRIAGERLVQELIRLRKKGRLPRIRASAG